MALRRWIAVGLGIGLSAQATLSQEQAPQWFSPRMGDAEFTTRYSFTTGFNEPVGRQNADMQMSQYDFGLSYPFRQSESDEWTMHLGFKGLDIDSDARLPGTWVQFPGELWNVRLGTTYRHRLDEDSIVGANLTVGSASDRPFAGGDEITVNGTGFLRIPEGGRNAWIFLVNYANDRDFLPNVPLPGVAYQYRPDDRFSLMAGLPAAAVRWNPIDPLTLEAAYFVPRTVHAQIGYRPLDALQIYARYDWENQRFFRHDRRDDDDRLVYYEMRASLGARWDICEQFWLDLAAGWAFDRFWYEGEDYGDRGGSRLNLSDGPVVKLLLGLEF